MELHGWAVRVFGERLRRCLWSSHVLEAPISSCASLLVSRK